MTSEKLTSIDFVTSSDDGVVFYRESITELQDGVEVSKKYHRNSLIPGSSLENVPAEVADLCNSLWNQEVISFFKSKILKGA
jgi:hypothetical protein